MRSIVYQLAFLCLLMAVSVNVEAQMQRCECNAGKRTMATLDPEYPGGMTKMIQDLNTLVDLPADLNGEGFIRFVINCRGEMCKPIFHKRIGMDVDDQLATALGELPKWSPGFFQDQPVDANVALKIVIKDGRIQVPE